MSKKFKLILIISIITLLVIGGGVTGIVIANKLTATTMRLKDTDGSVFLFSKDNRQRNITYDLRLQNGNRLETDSLSEARVSLDDTKLVVVKQVSTVHFEQRAKKLKLLLDEGSIFFYVSRKLTENEELNICTSSMMAGIRGTSGYLDIKDERTQILYLTSGKVEITIAGSDEKYTVTAGEKLTLTDGINARVESFKATEMPHDLIEEVVDSVKLINTVCEETGWNIADIINNADQRGIKVNKLVREIIGQTEENHNIPDDTSGRDDVGEDAQTSDERNDQDQATSNDNNETDPENIPESEWKADRKRSGGSFFPVPGSVSTSMHRRRSGRFFPRIRSAICRRFRFGTGTDRPVVCS